jgi:hypothetical protein
MTTTTSAAVWSFKTGYQERRYSSISSLKLQRKKDLRVALSKEVRFSFRSSFEEIKTIVGYL